MFTNINIIDSIQDLTYSYIIEYEKTENIGSNKIPYILGESINKDTHIDDVIFCEPYTKYINHYNDWISIQNNNGIKDYLPDTYRRSKIRLYFPNFSADIYNTGLKYALTVNTWIKGKCIILASIIISRVDVLACNTVKTFLNQKYYEMFEIDIIDPIDILYHNDWKEFRENISNSSKSGDSVLYISLHPIIEGENGYIKANNLTGGQNSIQLIKNPKEFLSLNIKSNTNNCLGEDEPAIIFEPKFNSLYDDFISYLEQNYNLQDIKFQYGLAIGNEENLYANLSSEITEEIGYKFKKSDIYKSSKNFTSWDGYQEGMFIIGSLNIYDENNEKLLYILSNKLPFTPDLFKYFVNSEDFKIFDKTINNIDLNNLDMEQYNINVVNKIENKIIQYTTPTNDSKKNIIQPIFYKTSDSSDIIVYGQVVHTISINLDNYKSKVTTFVLKLGDANFTEIGRTNQGVLFKIDGKKIQNIELSGTYFILNEKFELVTTGKYTKI